MNNSSTYSYFAMNNNSDDEKDNETTKDEIYHWTIYDFANSPMSSPIFAFVLPLLLERLATQNVCSRPEITCDNDGDPLNGEKKYLDVLNITPTTFSFLVIGISVLCQTLSFISFGACADYGNKRKKYLLITSIVGSILTMFYIVCIQHQLWWFGGLLTIFVIVFYGLSTIYYNSFLPLMVRSHPLYLTHKRNKSSDLIQVEDQLNNEISARGYMLGYVGALIITIIIGPIFFFFPHEDIWSDNGLTWALIISILISGIWWFVFTLISAHGLKNREGPELNTTDNIIVFSWKRTYFSLKSLKQFPQLAKFIIAFFLYSDAYATIASTGILYARTELNTPIEILYILIIQLTIVSIVGNYLFVMIQKKYNLNSQMIIIIQLISFLMICIYGIIFLNKHFISLFIFGLIYGLIIGAIQSFSRSLFSQLIPHGFESQYYSFYAITDKGSNILGSFVIALLSQYTSLKYGFIYVIVLILISIPIMYTIDNKKITESESNIEIEINSSDSSTENSLETVVF